MKRKTFAVLNLKKKIDTITDAELSELEEKKGLIHDEMDVFEKEPMLQILWFKKCYLAVNATEEKNEQGGN